MKDLTIGITLHDEPFSLAYRTIRSAQRAAREAAAQGTSVGIVVCVSKQWEENCDKLLGVTHFSGELMHGPTSLGLKRNMIAERADSRYYCWLDGDDIMSKDWAWRGAAYLDKLAGEGVRDTIAHPQVNVYFGDERWWFQHIDQRDPTFNPEIFWDNNVWTSAAMASGETFATFPYRADQPGFGFEDWEWHKRTVANGALHVTVPRTASFVRRRSHSLNARSVSEKRLTLPSRFEFGLALHPHTNEKGFVPAPIGGWLEEQWKDAHSVEAELWPTPREIEKRTMFIPDTLGAPTALRTAVKALQGFDHVIVAPWLSVGGADLQIIEHARAAIEYGRRVVIVCTDDTLKNTWAGKTAATLVDLTTLIENKRARPAALLHALLANAPATLHVVNSAMGWLLLREHGRAIRQRGTRVVVSLFCEDRVPPSGRRLGYAYDGSFARAQEHIDAVLTDNVRFQKAFAEEFGTDAHLVQIPINMSVERLRYGPSSKRYLWASRFDFQKGVGILTQMASANPNCTFEVRGAALVEGKLPPPVKAARDALERMPNVIIVPGQWTWEGIAKENNVYAGFLYTAQWDGMPNVVLEAAARGLPVISTDVGDVAKLTGSVVALGAEAWVWTKMFEDARESGHDKIRKQDLYLREQHNEDRFVQQLEEALYL